MANSRRWVQPVALRAVATAALVAGAGACADPNAPPPNIGQSGNAQYNPQPPPGQYPQPQPQAAPGVNPGAPPNTYQPPPGYAQQPPPPGTSGAPATPGAQGPLGPIMTTDPAQLQAMFAQAAQAAQAFLQPPGSGAAKPGAAPAPGAAAPPGIPGGMPSDLIDAGIRAVALMQAQGMAPEGSQAKGQLAEGGHLEFMVPMQAGKCYTLIGFSPPGQIRNVDLNLLAPPFYNMLAGQDTTDDNVPVIGKAPNPMCPIVPVPLNYKVDIVARSGSGQVGVQLFSKTK